MPKGLKLVLVLGLVVGLPIVGFFAVEALRDRSITIGTVLADNGFVEFRPPSNLVEPGLWVQVKNTRPLHLSIICASKQNLGFPVDFQPLSSDSIDAEFSSSLKAQFSVTADLMSAIKAKPSLEAVEDVVFSLANVRLVEVADDQVRAAIRNRNPDCHESIKARFEEGVPVTMIKAALVADVRYKVVFRRSLDATTKAAAMRELALDFDLRTKAGDSSSQTLIGTGLVWGVREDTALASVGIGLPATGGSGPGSPSAYGILKGLGPVLNFDDGQQKGAALDAERRSFPAERVLVRHDLEAKRQSSRNACWATVYAMMTAWRSGSETDVPDVIRALGEPFDHYYVTDAGLPGGQEIAFVKAAGMRALPPANYTLTAFADNLRTYGPLWIITGDGISSHARLLVGIYGEAISETPQVYDTTIFEFIDPATGRYAYETAIEFMQFFEQEARYLVERENDTDLRWQILHWPA